MPSKARPRQTDRARDSATETPLETRRDFFRRRRGRQRSSRESGRGSGSTEWQCQQHPSRGCSFAGHQPQPSANVNHEYTRMNTNVVGHAVSDAHHTLDRLQVERVVLNALAKKMWLWPPDICAYRESLAI